MNMRRYAQIYMRNLDFDGILFAIWTNERIETGFFFRFPKGKKTCCSEPVYGERNIVHTPSTHTRSHTVYKSMRFMHKRAGVNVSDVYQVRYTYTLTCKSTN